MEWDQATAALPMPRNSVEATVARPSTERGVFRFIGPGIAMVALLAACSEPTICPQGGPIPAVSIQLRDQRGDTLVTGPVRGEIRDGSYRDSLVAAGWLHDPMVPVAFVAGHNRPGRYTLTLERDGFLPVERRDIYVADGNCGPVTANLVIPVQPDDGQ